MFIYFCVSVYLYISLLDILFCEQKFVFHFLMLDSPICFQTLCNFSESDNFKHVDEVLSLKTEFGIYEMFCLKKFTVVQISGN